MNKNDPFQFGFDAPISAVVFGTSGGIGSAISEQLHTGMTSRNATSTNKSDGQDSPDNRSTATQSIPNEKATKNTGDRGSTSLIVDSGQSFAQVAYEDETQHPRPSVTAGPCHLFGINRSAAPESRAAMTGLQADALDESQLGVAKEAVQHSISQHQHAPVRLIIVGIGTLHQPEQPGSSSIRPEKTWRDLSADKMAQVFATNTIAPALIAKHFLPLLPRTGRSVFAVLSARVGSISDNRLGGWYSYRASKAALNQIIKTTSIELARTRPDAICIGLHPGTVDTGLSKPFQANVAEGKLFTPEVSATYLLNVAATATPNQSGSLLAWDGSIVPA